MSDPTQMSAAGSGSGWGWCSCWQTMGCELGSRSKPRLQNPCVNGSLLSWLVQPQSQPPGTELLNRCNVPSHLSSLIWVNLSPAL